MKAGNTGGCTLDMDAANPSTVLGTPSVKPLDMASAYATFAANGVHHETHSIKKVTKGAEDKEVYKGETKGKRVFDKAVGAETSYALSQVVNGGSGSYAQNLGRPAAGKTGTTTGNTAAWFSGYTPNLATSVVLYREVDGKQMSIGAYGGRGEVTGGSFPVQVWTDYMQKALQGEKVEQFPARGELPDKPKPKNTNEPAAPKPEPKAPSGSNDGSDGGSDSSDSSGGSDEDSDADKNKDEDKNTDSDSKDDNGNDDSKDEDGREDNGSSNDEGDEGSDNGSGSDDNGSENSDPDGNDGEGGSEDNNEPPDEGPSGGLPIEPPKSPGGND